MVDAIKNRVDFMVLFDVKNGNPNGDPDAGNMPRIDPETNLGIVTDVCLKRKIRNYVEAAKEDKEGYKIYIKENEPLETKNKEAISYFGEEDIKKIKAKDPDIDKKIANYMCKNYYDIRTFGAVMTTFTKNGLNCGQVKGPVQITMANSVEPIVPGKITITRLTPSTEEEAKTKKTMIGEKYIVPYGLYKAFGYISANLADKTGFSNTDLNLLWEAVMNMFDLDHAAARGSMATRKLIIFKHNSKLGNVQAYKLFDRVKIEKKDINKVARDYKDYNVTVNTENLPEGIEIEIKD